MKTEIIQHIDKEEYNKAFDLVEKALKKNALDIDLLCLKADINKKRGLFGEALNQYNLILEHEPDNKKAKVEKEMILSIFSQINTDIYDCTNLYDDPWF